MLELPDNARDLIRRAIVPNENLERAIGLCDRAGKAFLEIVVIVGGNEHADQWLARRRHRSGSTRPDELEYHRLGPVLHVLELRNVAHADRPATLDCQAGQLGNADELFLVVEPLVSPLPKGDV